MSEATDIFATPYLTPADMERARRLQFVPRVPPEGLRVGQHASPQIGHAAEFNDYRPYTPGDDLADIDWKVLGRTDRLYIKRFEHQTDMAVTLLIDASASMAYDGGKIAEQKYAAACRIAAMLSATLLQQHDRVSIGVAQQGLAQWQDNVRTPSQLAALLFSLHQTRPARRAELPRALRDVVRNGPQRSVLIVLSDLVDDRLATLAPLIAHRAGGGEALLVHVLHPHELALPFDRPVRIIDSETGKRVDIDGRAERRRYEQQMADHLERWRSDAMGAGVDYLLCRSDQSAVAVLRDHLAARQIKRLSY
jgi:uncharacterized protein (DUF58 family)